MPVSVLGKRNRQCIDTADEPVCTRSKRRVLERQLNDENRNPFAAKGDHDGEDRTAVDEPLTRGRRKRALPAEHTSPESRKVLSPTKITKHFQVSKPSVDIYQDGKEDFEPQTPRQRDALSKKVPITPRHRVLLPGNPGTPKTPVTPSATATLVYNQARKLFSRCSHPGKLVGRDTERQELSAFIEQSLQSHTGGSLYVSGPPGTGKSALVDEVRQQLANAENVSTSVVNCMSIRNAKDLTQKLSEDLALEPGTGSEHLRLCFSGGKLSGAAYLVILDEVDRLADLDIELLYSLFEWSMLPSSRLTLIGIANALDLTDRFLPRLKSRNLKPELLPFMPYTAAQIAEVLTAKLKSLAPEPSPTLPFLHPAAVQFCAKKVAAQTGDLRKAFDICRRAIDLVEQEERQKLADTGLPNSPSKTPLMENINLSSPPTPRSPAKSPSKGPAVMPYTIETAPKATIAQMAKVTAQVFGNGTTQRLAVLNLQQKAVLCSLAALEKRKRDTQVERTIFATPSKHNGSAPSIRQLFEAYGNLCKREKLLQPLSSVEFRDVVSGLETLSLISGADGKTGSFAMPITPSRTPSRKARGGFGATFVGDERRVASVVAYQELSAALEGVGGELLKEILNGDDLL
ncbi:hypothetical protein BAUCODRAFT_39538 [Baudoinia panamericana UAMH 10762]|uniref:Cell division control protein n=1 Tax=Baudoinia panamericana (strain UAMH 10762) TaxID=717646 RepID=M2M457_BAUPA|nr:uncharacterized protein BAUCODRAFT_39538 [Baudoinia panamericana UAMH 10762]EMC91371.1 hypothetical protein BAUCODRAFT_39538 [Baudoinia panamericana UAMH 10762]